MSSLWGKDDIATLHRRWMAGDDPRDIAADLGRTYMSIIGRANRDALPSRDSLPRVRQPQIPFDELDTVPLPRTQRIVLGALLAAHPYGVTCGRLGDLLSRSPYDQVNLINRAVRTVEGLRRKLRTLGWDCRTSGDRRGYRIVKNDDGNTRLSSPSQFLDRSSLAG